MGRLFGASEGIGKSFGSVFVVIEGSCNEEDDKEGKRVWEVGEFDVTECSSSGKGSRTAAAVAPLQGSTPRTGIIHAYRAKLGKVGEDMGSVLNVYGGIGIGSR